MRSATLLLLTALTVVSGAAAGADAESLTDLANTVLELAIRDGSVARVTAALALEGADADGAVLTDDGYAPLQFAAKLGAPTAVARALLDAGADPSRPHYPTDTTPLMFAAREGHGALVDLLLDALLALAEVINAVAHKDWAS